MNTTMKNLECALAGESVAHVKYRYFAKLAREAGYEDVAKHFEHTANQEILHAWSHLELLIGQPSVIESLEMAIEGETHEYTEMYPNFERLARLDRDEFAAKEFADQIKESSEHAVKFAHVLEKAQKRFAALTKVEERHANAYKEVLQKQIGFSQMKREVA